MAETVEGFPFWTLTFDENGRSRDPGAIAALTKEIGSLGLSDLIVFSHGWNNDRPTAMALYAAFFAEVRKLLNDTGLPKKRNAMIGTAGVVWPSIKWPDEGSPGSVGGAASLGPEVAPVFEELKKVFPAPDERRALETLAVLLDERERSEDALRRAQQALATLVAFPVGDARPADLEQHGLTSAGKWREVFEALAEESGGEESGGAAGLGDVFGKLWRGAKDALRVATYWKMKHRAGVVGREGLGPTLGRLHEASPSLRIHLLGHSFGARVVSYALAGLPSTALNPSPVKSLFLLQGAFSHFTFAEALPFDKTRTGDLAGMSSRVDGPLLTTHSRKDLAVGVAYPLASIVAGQNASALEDPLYEWEAMGHDGAQAVAAREEKLGNAGAAYAFTAGRWLNLDGNAVIVNGGPPSGAHGDIIHPHTAWAALAAAGVV